MAILEPINQKVLFMLFSRNLRYPKVKTITTLDKLLPQLIKTYIRYSGDLLNQPDDSKLGVNKVVTLPSILNTKDQLEAIND